MKEKILHAIPAWSGFIIWQRIEALYRRDDPIMAKLVADMDETLFAAVVQNNKHVVRYILPDRRNHLHCLAEAWWTYVPSYIANMARRAVPLR